MLTIDPKTLAVDLTLAVCCPRRPVTILMTIALMALNELFGGGRFSGMTNHPSNLRLNTILPGLARFASSPHALFVAQRGEGEDGCNGDFENRPR